MQAAGAVHPTERATGDRLELPALDAGGAGRCGGWGSASNGRCSHHRVATRLLRWLATTAVSLLLVDRAGFSAGGNADSITGCVAAQSVQCRAGPSVAPPS